VSLSNAETTRLLLALVVLLIAAHGMGQLACRLGWPRVAGEIGGGLLLGPSLLGWASPSLHTALFRQDSPTAGVLGGVYQLGLFLLMFCSGASLRSAGRRADLKAVAIIATIGNVVPFGLGLLFIRAYPADRLIGDAHNNAALVLVFATAIAVTSIPVISKIMTDLGILGTRFARIVLGVAIVEDVVLYVILSVTLGMVRPSHSEAFSLPGMIQLAPSSLTGDLYYIAASTAFFVLPLVLGRDFLNRLAARRLNIVSRSNPLAFQLVFVLGFTALALFLGVAAYFGAFVAGIMAGRLDGEHARAYETIRSFSFAVFIPLYFAVVGLRLDLVRQFDVLFFLAFLAFACAAKALSAYAGARVAGQGRRGSLNLAAALNARGGPAIVLASVALDARIINEKFYSALIMLALVTSMAAGAWLRAVLRQDDDPTRADDLLRGRVAAVSATPAVAAPTMSPTLARVAAVETSP